MGVNFNSSLKASLSHSIHNNGFLRRKESENKEFNCSIFSFTFIRFGIVLLTIFEDILNAS
jgi:hypothetical protein